MSIFQSPSLRRFSRLQAELTTGEQSGLEIWEKAWGWAKPWKNPWKNLQPMAVWLFFVCVFLVFLLCLEEIRRDTSTTFSPAVPPRPSDSNSDSNSGWRHEGRPCVSRRGTSTPSLDWELVSGLGKLGTQYRGHEYINMKKSYLPTQIRLQKHSYARSHSQKPSQSS